MEKKSYAETSSLSAFYKIISSAEVKVSINKSSLADRSFECIVKAAC